MKKRENNRVNSKTGFRANGPILPLALRPGLGFWSGARAWTLGRGLLGGVVSRRLVGAIAVVLAAFCGVFAGVCSEQEAFASSVTLTVPSEALSLEITPNSGTVFQKSSAGTIRVATDSSYGYTLSIYAKNGDSESGKSNDLLNGESKISSIVSALNEEEFQSSGESNTWGYMPSKLDGSVNSDFQPGPTADPTTLDVADSSSEGTDYNITLATKIDNTLPAGNYHNTFVLTAVSNDPAYDDIMQNWSGCDDLPEETKTLNLLDTRDNKTYTVAKLKDGQCWMTENIAIGNNKTTTELTSENTDLPDEVSTYLLPQGSTDGFSDYTSADIYIDNSYGGYYSWGATTAGTGGSITDGEATGSVCPKGWKLPTKAEFMGLTIAYNSEDASGSSALRSAPANFILAGSYHNGSWAGLNQSSSYWSSTADSDSLAWAFTLNSINASVGWPGRSSGYSVRCVARSTNVGTLQTVSEWGDNVQNGQTLIATDNRDNKEYTVARLADGKLWMTKNLEIENKTLTPTDSDVALDFQIPTSTDRPNQNNTDNSKELYIDKTYGGYYTWYTATAGEGTQNKSSGVVAHSICPKGWRLPTKQDFVNLDKALGGTGENRPDNNIMFKIYQAMPNNFKLGGYFENGFIRDVTNESYYWSSSTLDSTLAYNLYFRSNDTYPQHYSNKVYLNSVRCISRTDDPPTLQDVFEWGDSVQEEETILAIDARDGKTYTVSRLKDGRLWMTKNLEIENYTLTSEDSDVASDFQIPFSTSTPNYNNMYDSKDLHIDSVYGGYYTWYTATAGEGTQSISTDGQNLEHSICPKDWRLPTKDDFVALDVALGGSGQNRSDSTMYQTYEREPNNFLMSGYYNSGSLASDNKQAYYWSSTVYTSSNVYLLSFANNFVNPYYNNPKGGYLFSIRCISRTDDPLPEMQNVSEWGSSVETNQEIRTVDSRDNEKYTVARLADDKLWMTKNLEIEDYTLTSADSDVSSKFQIPASIDIPNLDNSFESKDLHIDKTYGGYYTWYTATAGEGIYDKSSGDVSHSICPKGWRLPTYSEFVKLWASLGGTGIEGATALLSSPANFKKGGLYYNGSWGSAGIYGYYWSSTPYSSEKNHAMGLCFDDSKISGFFGAKGYGNSVRCVSRE